MSDNSISFVVPGKPVAFARSGANGKTRFTPAAQRNFMALVRLCAASAMAGRPLLEGPLEMSATFIYEVPASWSKVKRAVTKWKDSRPDSDNLAKLCADSMNAVVWHDDAQVASLFVQKLYGECPEIVVTVRELEPNP